MSPLDFERAKQVACDRIDARAPELIDLSRRIWETPEVAFEEHRAAGWLANLLSDARDTVDQGVGGPVNNVNLQRQHFRPDVSRAVPARPPATE